MGRLEERGLLEVIESAPEHSKLQDAEPDFEIMQELFAERSLVWRKGGGAIGEKGS